MCFTHLSLQTLAKEVYQHVMQELWLTESFQMTLYISLSAATFESHQQKCEFWNFHASSEAGSLIPNKATHHLIQDKIVQC